MTSAVIEHRYVCRGAAADLFDSTAPEILIEGPAGTGKSRAALEKANWLCEEYPGIRVLLARQTRASLTESALVTWENKVLWLGHPALSGSDASRSTRHSYTYPNGSVVVPGSLETPERLYSTEWDVVIVDEATEISLDAWEKFGRGMRSHKMPYQQQIAVCNPAAPGHWLNQRANTGLMVRLKSKHTDNPSCTPEYLKTLASMTGHRRARLYEGRWVAGEGTVYPEFDDARHVIKPFDIPADWPMYVAIDPGYDCPCAIVWIAVAPNGCYYCIDEIYRGGMSVQQHVAGIHARNAGRTILRYYGDPNHCFSRTAQSVKSIASQMTECGIQLSPWPRATNITPGVNMVRNRLINGQIKIFSTCTNIIQEFQSWSFKRNASGEALAGDDQYEHGNDHSLDCIRGLVTAHVGDASMIRVFDAGASTGRAARSILSENEV